MMKKNVLLTLLVASLALGATLSLNSCKKSTDGDLIPVVTEVLRGPGDFVYCVHCNGQLFDRTYAVDPDDWDHFHQHYYGPAYLPDYYCPIPNCRYNERNHVHEVYYYTDKDGDHYQDDWIHLGGGAGGE